MDSLIDVYFGTKSDAYFNSTGEAVFKKQLYQSMLAQVSAVTAVTAVTILRGHAGAGPRTSPQTRPFTPCPLSFTPYPLLLRAFSPAHIRTSGLTIHSNRKLSIRAMRAML